MQMDVEAMWEYMVCTSIQEVYSFVGELQFNGLTAANITEAEDLQARAMSTVDMWMKKWDASAEVEYSEALVRLVKGKGKAMVR